LSAVKKLKAAKNIHQTLYIYSATGYGKTTLVKKIFENKKYFYFSCQNGFWRSEDIPKGNKTKSIVISEFSQNALEILQFQSEGISQSEIAKRIGISVNTVKYHIKQNYIKLGVSNKSEALIEAKNLNLI